MSELSPEALKAVETIEKLLRLAAKNPNEAEAAAAASKAQALLVRYNLTMDMLERNSGDTGKREDARQKGGLYTYQRDLWRAVAKLNFCLYFNMYVWDKDRKRVSRNMGRVVGGWRFEHRLVGRSVNVAATRNAGS